MAFDPDAYLAGGSTATAAPAAFDPDAYLATATAAGFDPDTYLATAPTVAPDQPGIGDDIANVGRALYRGVQSLKQGLNAQFLDETQKAAQRADKSRALAEESAAALSGAPAIVRTIAGSQQETLAAKRETTSRERSALVPEALTNIVVAEKAKQAAPATGGLAEFQTSPNWLGVLARNPIEVVSGLIAESLPQMAPGMIATAVGGPVAGLAVSGAASFQSEYASGILDSFAKAGANLADADNLESFFNDPEKLAKAREYATARGIPIAVTNAATAGLAGLILKSALGKGIGRVAVASLAELGLQASGGAIGEAGAQLASEGQITDLRAVASEAIAELGSGPAEVFGNVRQGLAKVSQTAEATLTTPPPAPDPAINLPAQAPTVEAVEQSPAIEATETPEQAAGEPVASAAPSSAKPDVNSQGFPIGPGKMTEGELGPQKKLGGYNADVEASQKARGQTPTLSEARKEDPVTFKNAMEAIEKDPNLPEKLVEDIHTDPKKPITDEQQQMLTWRRADLENKMALEAERAIDPNLTPDEQAAAQSSAEVLEAQLLRTEQANRMAGTASGRSLRSRQLEMNDDYTFAGLMMRERKMTGDVVSKERRTEIEKTADDFKKAQASEQAASATSVEADFQSRKVQALESTIADLQKAEADRPKYGQEVLDRAERIVTKLETRAEAASKRLRKKFGGTSAGVDPTIVLDVAEIMAARIGRAGVKSVELFRDLTVEFGNAIEPYLEAALVRAKKIIGQTTGGGTRKIVEEGVSKPKKGEKTPAKVGAKAKAEAEAGMELRGKTAYEAVRSVINSGVKGEPEIMAAALNVLRPYYPELTLRQLDEKFTDYGNARSMSQEQTAVALRKQRQLRQMILKIQDLEKTGEAPRFGVTRDKPDADVRLRIKELKAAVDKFSKDVPDTPEMIASREATAIRGKENAIERLDRQLQGVEEEIARTPREQSAKVEQLQSQLDAMRELKRELDDAANPPPPEHVIELKRLQDRADILRDRLARMELAQPKAEGKPTVDTAEIAAAKTEIKTLAETMADLRKKPKTPEHIRELQKIQDRLDAAKDRLARGELSAPKPDRKPTVDTAEIAAAKAELKAVNVTISDLRKPKPESPAQKALDSAQVARERAAQTLDDLASGKVKDPAKIKEALTQLEEDVRSETDAMKQLAAEMRRDAKPKKDPGYAKEQAQIKALEKAIATYAGKTARGDFAATGKPLGPDSRRVAQLKEIRDSRRAMYQSARDAGKPVLTPEQRYNATRLKALTKREAELRERLRAGNFGPKPKKVNPALEKATLDAQLKVDAVKQEFLKKQFEWQQKQRSIERKIWDGIKQTTRAGINIISSADFSGPRQALGAILANTGRTIVPVELTRNAAGSVRPGVTNPLKSVMLNLRPLAKMYSSAFSEQRALRMEKQRSQRPNAKSGAYKEMGLELSSLDNTQHTKHEEMAHSILDEWAQLPLRTGNVAKSAVTALFKVGARVVRGSNRGFNTLLNEMRVDMADYLLETNYKDRAPTTAELKVIGNLVNIATGRGNLNPKIASAAGAVFWAPSLFTSRVKGLAMEPIFGAKQPLKGTGRARSIAAKEYARIIISGYILWKAAQMFDEKEEKDPTSSDYGKIVRGNTRIDPWGGHQQVVTATARAVKGTTKSVDGKSRKNDLGQVIMNFGRNKLRPDWGVLWNAYDIHMDKVKPGHPKTYGEAAASMATPMALREVVKVMKDRGFTESMIIEALGVHGAGVNVYEKDEKESRRP